MKKRVLAVLAASALAATMMPVTAFAGEDDLITVGYAQVGAESDWRTANTESFKSTFTEENGYNYQYWTIDGVKTKVTMTDAYQYYKLAYLAFSKAKTSSKNM